MQTRKKNLFLGVDIGGTKVAAGLLDSTRKILRKTRTRMVARRRAEDGLRAVFDALDGILLDRRARKARAIGVSVPGWADSTRGVLLAATNIPCWRNFPLAEEIERRYHLPARIGNDANVAALAEAAWGAGAGHQHVFYASLGTGVGTGIVLDHRIYDGRTGAAAEGGHTTINFRGPRCGCGKRGCIEMYASGASIARRAREMLAKQRRHRSRILEMAGGRIASVTAEHVAKTARAGDKVASKVLAEAADSLAIWFGNMIDLLEPDVIVVGGGIGPLMMSFISRIREGLITWAINPRQQQIPIVGARYGAESALVGTAALCMSYQGLWPRASHP